MSVLGSIEVSDCLQAGVDCDRSFICEIMRPGHSCGGFPAERTRLQASQCASFRR